MYMMEAPEKRKEQCVPFFKLFCFADRFDCVVMAASGLGAVVHGSSMPVFFLLFGQRINGFGKNQADLEKLTQEVSKYALYFVYLGLIVCLSSYAELCCWMYACRSPDTLP